jgi:predicted transcriptional regulator
VLQTKPSRDPDETLMIYRSQNFIESVFILEGLTFFYSSFTMAQRDRYDIFKELLEIVHDAKPLYRNQMNQTRIGYEAGLTHPQTVNYLRILVGQGLLVLTDSKPYSYYEITKNGRRCIQLFGKLEDDLRPIVMS